MLRRAHCYTCKQSQPFELTKPNHILHLLLSCCTLGFWLPIWAMLTVIKPLAIVTLVIGGIVLLSVLNS
ncbi:MAG: hypothetical protein V4719_01740 [Planctomycetota bacterium]